MNTDTHMHTHTCIHTHTHAHKPLFPTFANPTITESNRTILQLSRFITALLNACVVLEDLRLIHGTLRKSRTDRHTHTHVTTHTHTHTHKHTHTHTHKHKHTRGSPVCAKKHAGWVKNRGFYLLGRPCNTHLHTHTLNEWLNG